MNLLKGYSKNFKTYYLGLVISNLGNALTALVLPLLILDLTNSALHLSSVSALSVLPYAILGLPFGALVDRFNLKKVLILSDLIRFFAYLGLFISMLILPKSISIVAIYFTSLISGVCFVFHSISESTIIPRVVEKERLSTANSLIFGSQYVINLFAPMLGGGLYSLKIVPYFFLFDAMTYIVSVLCLYNVRGDFKTNISGKINALSIYKDISSGFKILKSEKLLMNLLVIISILNLVLVSYYNNILIFLKTVMHQTPEQIGLILGVASLGSLAGAFLTTPILKKWSYSKIIITLLLIDGISRLIIPLSNMTIFIILFFGCAQLSQSILNIAIITYRQSVVKQEYLGRVSSVFKTIIFASRPLGLFIGGVMISSVGVYNTMITAGVMSLVLCAFSFFLLNKKSSVQNVLES